MTPRKRWPYEAEAGRMEGIAQARRGLRKLEPIIEQVDSAEVLRGAAEAADSFHRIITALVEARAGKEDRRPLKRRRPGLAFRRTKGHEPMSDYSMKGM
jgi:hypothetical protein